MSILNTVVGQQLSPLVKPAITKEQLRRYAEASGDFNPIHLDEQAAHRVGLDGVIAHGMLSMAFLGQFVSQHIADIPGAYIEQLKARFVNMVHLGDTITCHGIVKERITDEATSTVPATHVIVECWAQHQKGNKVTTGEAVVSVPHRSN